MKMISSTSRTSISGVTLMTQLWPPLPPIAIAIKVSLSHLLGSAGRWCARGLVLMLSSLLSEQAQIIHAGCTHIVHDVHHDFIASARISTEKNSLVRPIRDAVFDPVGKCARVLHQVAAEKDIALTGNRHHQRVFFVGIGHLLR